MAKEMTVEMCNTIAKNAAIVSAIANNMAFDSNFYPPVANCRLYYTEDGEEKYLRLVYAPSPFVQLSDDIDVRKLQIAAIIAERDREQIAGIENKIVF